METFLTILSYVAALLIVGIIIMVHELGHYSIGRATKIKVVEFAVGFGPKIKSWVKNDIIYSIRWVFLGGFTKFYGEDEDLDDKLAFNKQPAWRRALTIAAGPVFNIIFAFVFAVIVLTAFGEFVPVVSDVWEGGPAQEAGLREGDVIVEMNGAKMDFYMQLGAAERNANDESTPITVLRDGEEISADIPKIYYERIPEANRDGRTDEQMIVNGYMSGISIGGKHQTYGFLQAVANTFTWTFAALIETFFGVIALLGGIFTGNIPAGSMGIVEIVEEIGYALRTNFVYLMQLCAAINISLAVFNLLPIPALDGGRLVFIGIEKVFRKPVPRKVEAMIHFVGFILLFALMGFFLIRGIAGIFGG